jgi:MoaA/NifB/PqqE/SkfB family radical SAM enzyme
MARIVIELTNRCNLSCTHCFDGRHSADGDLKIEIIQKICQSAKAHGFNHLSFTGGDPTVHPGFIEIIKMVFEAGYKFGFVTNGQNFTKIYQKILPYCDRLTGITFSLDGAREETHDRLRGKGSYRRVIKAVSICVVKDIPFTFNMVITSHNRNELEEMAELATKLRSRGLRFGHLLPTPLTTVQNLGLSPEEQKQVEDIVWQIQKSFPIQIAMAPGYYTTNLFPCAPLQMEEFNIDWRGNVTKCCHLSSHGGDVGDEDVIGNLSEMSFSEAYERLVESNRKFHLEKLKHHSSGNFKDSDYFPCWYCENYFKKVDWLKRFPKNPWSSRVWNNLSATKTQRHKEGI